MSQAANACTTRRGLFGGLAIVAGATAAAALPAVAAPRERSPAERLINRLEGGWGEKGRKVAEMAVAAGYVDDDLYTILLMGSPDNQPAIMLDRRDRIGDPTEKLATFTPKGRSL